MSALIIRTSAMRKSLAALSMLGMLMVATPAANAQKIIFLGISTMAVRSGGSTTVKAILDRPAEVAYTLPVQVVVSNGDASMAWAAPIAIHVGQSYGTTVVHTGYVGISRRATVTVEDHWVQFTLNAVRVHTFLLSPGTVQRGGASTATVTLAHAASDSIEFSAQAFMGGFIVNLGAYSIPAGQTSFSFPIYVPGNLNQTMVLVQLKQSDPGLNVFYLYSGRLFITF